MTSRELVLRTLLHQPTDRAPRDLSVSAQTEADRPDDVVEIQIRFPSDIIRPEFDHPTTKRGRGKSTRSGDYVDAWGCAWHVGRNSPADELKHAPLADPAKIAQYRPPQELLKPARFDQASRSAATTSRFVVARAATQPLSRLRWLRGDKEALADLVAGTAEVRSLAAMLHEFSCREMQAWAAAAVDGVVIRDDWGTPDGLVVDAGVWRDLFRPMYREYCRILREADKFVFFQSEGDISAILGDLVKHGVDAVHADLQAMGVDRLAKRYRGRITFWGDAGVNRLLATGSPTEIAAAVQRTRRALDAGSGGLVAHCRWEIDAPLRHVAGFFEQWMLPLPVPAAHAGQE